MRDLRLSIFYTILLVTNIISINTHIFPSSPAAKKLPPDFAPLTMSIAETSLTKPRSGAHGHTVRDLSCKLPAAISTAYII